jgi:hypothetical protein
MRKTTSHIAVVIWGGAGSGLFLLYELREESATRIDDLKSKIDDRLTIGGLRD